MANWRLRLNTLTFKSYGGDPVARLVLDRLKWHPWAFAAVYVGTYLALATVALAFYTLFHERSFNLNLLGGYPDVVATLLFNIVAMLIGGRIYIYASVKSGELYEDLAMAGVIRSSDAAVRELVCGETGAIEPCLATPRPRHFI